jgi:phosphatidate phosphatase APP1
MSPQLQLNRLHSSLGYQQLREVSLGVAFGRPRHVQSAERQCSSHMQSQAPNQSASYSQALMGISSFFSEKIKDVAGKSTFPPQDDFNASKFLRSG